MRMLFVFLLWLLVALICQAQTVRYVSDTLEVPLRSGTSTNHRILSMLKSGTEVQALRTDAKSGYTQVRVGTSQGWILSRYLMDAPAAREALEPITSENENLQQQLETLTARNAELESRYGQLREEHESLSQELAQIRTTAANAIAIDEQNRHLQEQAVNLEKSLQIVQQENQSLDDNQQQSWFLLGALVLLGGIFLGLIIPRLSFHRRNRWGEL